MDSLLASSTLPHMSQDTPFVTRTALARAAKNAVNQGRIARNALYRHGQFLNSLPQDAKAYHQKNRHAQGLPRAYSLRFTDPTVDHDDPAYTKLNGQTLLIGEHGSNDTGMYFNGHEIHPSVTTFSAATNSYFFKSTLKASAETAEADVAAFINLAGAQPSGVLAVGDKTFNIHLDQAKVWFDVNVAADAGAYFSTGAQKLKWDATSTQWASASWESAGLTFGYDVKNIGDSLQPRWVAENTFFDNSSNPPTEFDLASTDYSSQYTSTMATSNTSGSSMLTQVITTPPAAPPSRADKPVKSVFPNLWQVEFSPFGDSFSGAYRDANGDVYAVVGMVRLEDDASLVTLLSPAPTDLPVQNMNPGAEGALAGVSGAPVATEGNLLASIDSADSGAESLAANTADSTGSMLKAAPQPILQKGAGPPPLQVFELLSLNPMVQDSTDPSGWRDSVAQLAMSDFHNLIIYFMEPDLRTMFVQAAAPVLTPAVLAVASDDVASGTGENKTFYQKLQIPYIVSMLAAGKLDQAKYCNGKRADARLKDIPSHDPVYKRHTAKLYRAHFVEKFPSISKYLHDQRNNNYTTKINAFATSMKNNIASRSAGLKDPDSHPNYDTQLAAAKKDIDGLVDWAKERSLYWALQLLYYVQNSALPNWFSQYTAGSNTSNLSMMQKQLNALFGLLENDQINTVPGGRNFMQAYNDDMRLFQMTSIIPTLVDARGNSQEIDTLIVECLSDYIDHFKASADQNHADAVAAAEELFAKKELRDKFWIPLINANRIGAAARSWTLTMKLWEDTVKDAEWFRKMAGGARVLAVFQAATAVVLIVMPLMPGMWSKMTTTQQLSWKLSLAGLCAMLVIKIIQGAIRFYYLGGDIVKAGFRATIKCILGCDSVIDAIEKSAGKIQGSWAKFFTRTSKQTLAIQEGKAATIGEAESFEFSNVERILGRNMGEVIGTIAGLALAAVSIVMTAIDLAHQNDDALVAMDVMMVISSVIQILGVVAGWVAVATAAAASGTLLATTCSVMTFCATWSGPAAIVFAIIGIIIFMIWYFTQDHEDPIDKFLDDRVQPVGLRMPGEKQAPEYFGVVPADASNPSLVGLAIHGPLASIKEYQTRPTEEEEEEKFGFLRQLRERPPPKYATLKIPDGQQQFISLDVDTKKPSLIDNIDYSMNTIWSLSTDPDGKSMISTASFTQGTDTNGNPTTSRTLWYLGTSDDNTQVEYRELPSQDNADQRNAVLPHVLWTINVLTQPTQDTPDVKNADGIVTKPGNVLSAVLDISQNGAKLGRWVDRRTGKLDTSLALATDANAITGKEQFPDRMLCATWTVSMQPIGPSEFEYLWPTWSILDTDTDRRNAPHFLLPGTFSEGLQWTIEPALPSGVFELVTTAGDDEGIIRQVTGKRPPPMPATTYTVSCALMVRGVASGTRKAQVIIEVVHDTGSV